MPRHKKQAPTYIVLRTELDPLTHDKVCTCLCRCGKEFTARLVDLGTKEVTSCGCTETGEKEAKDTVEEETPTEPKKKTRAFAPRSVPSRTGEIHGYITIDKMVRDPAGNIYWKWYCVCGFRGKHRTKAITAMTDTKTCGSKRCENMMRNGLTIDEAHAIVRKYRNRS